ncbi:MAG: hypothetical protein KIT86_06990 [Hydrogenophaga sp.]|uniref:hypothetical protein n=1 Tax=Hydrogenophaga sp. TaxID=1904254 RepID=UPI00262F82D8|nr:hypothetical protein [Hydrogenophaga sp.]MCW5669390.1 hypothetical protein [Hydrogenophaga sp.]
MLADGPPSRSSGKLKSGVIANGHSRAAILDFILDQLPRWRDRPDRPQRTSETPLTSQLCAHLNSAARKTAGVDYLQFRSEEADEMQPSRKIDMVAAPAVDALVVEGRTYSDFETILPIECKRLPTPSGTGRDEREYVITKAGASGGIQRYKEGKHGSTHERAALIAYVQSQTFEHWQNMIEGWIRELHMAGSPGWTSADALTTERNDVTAGIAVHESVHTRGDLPAIRLRHMWISMQR